MSDRPKFFDDLAGVAGGAMSALAGLRDEAESTMRARAEEMIRKLDLVRREDLDAVAEMAANARAAQALAEARLHALEAKVAALSAAAGGDGPSTPSAVTPAGSSAVGHAAAAASASAAATVSAAGVPPVSASAPVLPADPIAPRPADDSVAEGSPS